VRELKMNSARQDRPASSVFFEGFLTEETPLLSSLAFWDVQDAAEKTSILVSVNATIGTELCTEDSKNLYVAWNGNHCSSIEIT